MFSVHTTPDEVDNGGFTLKTRQMFSIHTPLEKLENATITGYFGFLFEETSVREITYLDVIILEKLPFYIAFRQH